MSVEADPVQVQVDWTESWTTEDPSITIDDSTDVTWLDGLSGEDYALVNVARDEGVSTGTAGSPVTFSVDEEGTYRIETWPPPTTASAFGPLDEERGGLGLL